jgi:Xaa-Pro aminopeptidase
MLIKEKMEAAKQLLNEFNIDCWLTFVRETKVNGDPVLPFLVTADVTWQSAFCVMHTGETCAIVGLYDQKTVEETGAYDRVIGYVEGIKKPLTEYLSHYNPRTIAVNFSRESEICDGLTHGMYLNLLDIIKEIGMDQRLVSAQSIISALRERKSKEELLLLQHAIKITEEIFNKVSAFIRPGCTEKEIAAFMKNLVQQKNLALAWEESSCPAVFTGPETAGAHYAPTDRQVQRGHVLNMDFGVRYQNYCSDMQRTFYILSKGETEPPDDVVHGFNTIVQGIEEAKQALKPGVKGVEVDMIARNVLAQNGYEAFPHALGHQVGRFAHDGTALLGPAWEKYGQRPFQAIEENMVFTIEPRLTVPDKGVVTIEEMVVVKPSGAEYLSQPQKELILI